MSFKPKAVFTFFSLTTCGHCKVYKGEMKNKDGSISIDPKSGWEVLRNDDDLYNAGVEFRVYLVGNVKNPKTGKIELHELEDGYKGKWRGFPHLDLSTPDDPYNGLAFDVSKIRGWEASKSYEPIKKWILEQLKTPKFSGQRVAHAPAPAPAPIPGRSPIRNPRGRAPPQVHGNLPPVDMHNSPNQHQAPPMLPPQNLEALINQERASRSPNLFGMGTKEIEVVNNGPQEMLEKSPPRFLPANYDE